MIYFMTYLTFRKIFYQDIRYNIAELSVLKAMVRIPIVAECNYQNISEIITGWSYPPSYALHVYMLSTSDGISKIKVGRSWLTEGGGT